MLITKINSGTAMSAGMARATMSNRRLPVTPRAATAIPTATIASTTATPKSPYQATPNAADQSSPPRIEIITIAATRHDSDAIENFMAPPDLRRDRAVQQGLVGAELPARAMLLCSSMTPGAETLSRSLQRTRSDPEISTPSCPRVPGLDRHSDAVASVWVPQRLNPVVTGRDWI